MCFSETLASSHLMLNPIWNISSITLQGWDPNITQWKLFFVCLKIGKLISKSKVKILWSKIKLWRDSLCTTWSDHAKSSRDLWHGKKTLLNDFRGCHENALIERFAMSPHLKHQIPLKAKKKRCSGGTIWNNWEDFFHFKIPCRTVLGMFNQYDHCQVPGKLPYVYQSPHRFEKGWKKNQ